MDIERTLPDRMRTSVEDLRPDIAELVAYAATEGERKLRRRRVVRMLGAGVTLALLGGAGYLTVQPDNREASLEVATPVTGVEPAGQREDVQITPQASLRLLLDRLPASGRTGHYDGGSAFPHENKQDVARGDFSSRSGTWAQLSYTDAGGSSLIWVDLAWDDDALDLPSDCAGLTEGGDTCTAKTLADGSKLVLRQTHRYAPHAGDRGAKVWSAVLLRTDGLRVWLQESNSLAGNGETESRPAPPLTLDQLEKIVVNPTWQTELSAEYVQRAATLFTPREER